MNPEEKVLVISRKDIFGENNEFHFKGFKELEETNFLDKINNCTFFMNRGQAEKDPDHVQIIPFILVKKEDKFFAIEKLPATGDKREIGLFSIAVGGHINPIDGGENILIDGAAREFNEEVAYSKDFNGKLMGFVNAETNEFNSVHLGAIFLQEVDEDIDVHEKEKHIMRGKLMDKDELKEIYSKFGIWSQDLLDNIEKFL
jgi:predicted NUDIX family phosphoesterase